VNQLLQVGGGMGLGTPFPMSSAGLALDAAKISARPWESLAGKADIEVRSLV